MLRDCIRNDIFEALNYDIFRLEDFVIDEKNDNKSAVIHIQYNDYYFKLRFYANCDIEYSPGKALVEESFTMGLGTMEPVIKNIHEWLQRIKTDMLNPVEKRFIDESIRKFREKIDSKLNKMEDEYFSIEEGSELRERLEQLEKIFLEKGSQEELQEEILKMKEEIEFLKATVTTLTKKKWLKSALVKMWSWAQKEENRKLIEMGYEAVKTVTQIDVPKL